MVVIFMAMIAMAAAELWLFWQLGERDERRRTRMRVAEPHQDGSRRAIARVMATPTAINASSRYSTRPRRGLVG
jgi:hypothetical protein